jgi:two-component system response regulator HydG
MIYGRPKILIVDTNDLLRGNIRDILDREGHRVFEAKDYAKAIALVSREFFDLVLMENSVTKMDGIEALKEMRSISPGLQVIITEEFVSSSNAVVAFRSGAYDYMAKPIDIEILKSKIEQIGRHWRSSRFNIPCQKLTSNIFDTSLIVGRSKKMKDVLEMVATVASTEASVLLVGESGTEKELIADALHKGSNRAENRIIKINCSAFSEVSLENELFGHHAGDFSGPTGSKVGKLELADTGTIFLDEIGKMALHTQTRLLQKLQTVEFEPTGPQRRIKGNPRIIAASNSTLTDELKKGSFRRDLLYWLNVVQIELPPLRERKEDIIPLTNYFLDYYNQKNGRCLQGFSPQALDAIVRYSWPGNIMELKNVLERSVILTVGDYVQFHELPESIRECDNDPFLGPTVKDIRPGTTIHEMEKELITATLEHNDGNRTRSAKDLGVTRRTLQNKLKEYNMEQYGKDD